MLFKTIVVLFVVAVASRALSSGASARGGGHGGGGGFHGGGGFRGGGFRGGGFGFYGPYGYPFGHGGYYDGYESYESCYLVRQRIHTRYGWRVRRVQICD
jgi:hypothetical protein